jgi:phosphoribosylformylglycinamidine synthase
MPWTSRIHGSSNAFWRKENNDVTLWEVDIYPAPGQPDLAAEQIAGDAADMGLADQLQLRTARGYLVDGSLDRAEIEQISQRLLSDSVVETTIIDEVGQSSLGESPIDGGQLVYVLPKAGVMDPVALTARKAMADMGSSVREVRTLRKYWLQGVDGKTLDELCDRLLANDSIEQVVRGSLQMTELLLGSAYDFEKVVIPLRALNDQGLVELSRTGQLYMTLPEMRQAQAHFGEIGRDPTDIELESIAQTWSEHCSHKTLAGRIAYRDERGERQFDNMLKETIFDATQTIRKQLGDDDWCVSVFVDNAGVVRFDDDFNVVFKVETHNHPSALEPYGGANTGMGGVIRDPLGTGMGAKPVCNTDVFCFAPPDTKLSELPPGVLHPKRVMKGVVNGVRDYGNRMGIPTVNGAIYFDRRYLGNPLVYCGNVGIIPQNKSFNEPKAGDWVVAIGGRTGRDGIHGATFSSAELTSESESVSGGAVQIGNAITEKMVLDVLLQARDQELFNAVTDCGAGGFSSAVGEMGEKIGAEVWLEKAPLKYEGLTYTEIWISEAQERMVFSVPNETWQAFHDLCASEGVEATIIGRFEPNGRLVLKYHDQVVGDLSMEFLHNGRPPVIREATYDPPPTVPFQCPKSVDWLDTLRGILGSLNVASKEWVIRQYDHEVQGGSVVKPLVGVANDGPSDAAVIRPRLDSVRALAISCGMNPHYGDYDTYHMAASAIDEAVRNCVAVGADPSRIAILDNFCWGYTDRPETLGSLVRAAIACHDVAVGLQTPFISGKDSLNNEFSYEVDGKKSTIAIPATLLISAMGQLDDASAAVTMDLKQSGNLLYLIGTTYEEMAGSHFSLVTHATGGRPPRVDIAKARRTFHAVHDAITRGTIRACHDLSEGGLAVALAEMAFAGNLGVEVDLDQVPLTASEGNPTRDAVLRLFSESNTRFVCEVAADHVAKFEACFQDVPLTRIGTIVDSPCVRFRSELASLDLEEPNESLKRVWQTPLDWDAPKEAKA